MAIEDVLRDVANQQNQQAAETAAQRTAAEKAAAEKAKAAADAAKTTAQKKAVADLAKKQQQYADVIAKLAKGNLDERSKAVLTGQAVGLSDDISALKNKVPSVTQADTTTTSVAGTARASADTKARGGSTITAPVLSSSQELVPPGSVITGQVGSVSPTGMGAVGRGEYTPSKSTGGDNLLAGETTDKSATAIAKAIELYQMPDIIFSNVPELKTILDKYTRTDKPITLDQFVKEVGNSIWYRQNSKTIQNRMLQQFNYNDLKNKGQDTSNTQYEQDINKITQSVIDNARSLGAPVDPTQAKLIAEDLYIHNMESNTAALTKRLAGSIRQVPLGTTGISGYIGSAQANYQNLLKLAKNNGLDLNTILPSRVAGADNQQTINNVLSGLADGSLDYSGIEQTARTLAAQGQPQYVKDLLAQGYDLAQIYDPYKKVMSSVLEIAPDQINLNDPTLRSAISNTGDMNIYDFQKNLRKDSRWQYTQNAAQETSNAVLGVLRDFGFQG